MICCALYIQTCRVYCWNGCLEFKFNKQPYLQCPNGFLRVEGFRLNDSFKLKQERW